MGVVLVPVFEPGAVCFAHACRGKRVPDPGGEGCVESRNRAPAVFLPIRGVPASSSSWTSAVTRCSSSVTRLGRRGGAVDPPQMVDFCVDFSSVTVWTGLWTSRPLYFFSAIWGRTSYLILNRKCFPGLKSMSTMVGWPRGRIFRSSMAFL